MIIQVKKRKEPSKALELRRATPAPPVCILRTRDIYRLSRPSRPIWQRFHTLQMCASLLKCWTFDGFSSKRETIKPAIPVGPIRHFCGWNIHIFWDFYSLRYKKEADGFKCPDFKLKPLLDRFINNSFGCFSSMFKVRVVHLWTKNGSTRPQSECTIVSLMTWSRY